MTAKYFANSAKYQITLNRKEAEALAYYGSSYDYLITALKLRRINDRFGMTAFYEFPSDNGGNGTLGALWGGAMFPDGFVYKISLSAKDRV